MSWSKEARIIFTLSRFASRFFIMTEKNNPKKIDLADFYQNMAQSWAIYADILKTYAGKIPVNQPVELDPLNIGPTFIDAFGKLASEPEKVVSSGVQLYERYTQLWLDSAKKFFEKRPEVAAAPIKDRRFKDGAWDENPYFNLVKESYLVYADWLMQLTKSIDGLDKKSREKLEFYSARFIDAISPSNFLFTNPEVLRVTLETNAQNLVKGLQHLAEDIRRGNIAQTDLAQYEVGKNLGTTAGKVVYQNDLMQLIQYSPTTEKVAQTPILFIPAWINKYYIADLRPDNSLLKWAVDNGFTMFVISWVNPDARHKDKDFEDYMKEGILDAIAQIEKITGEKQINAIGYCLGGTLLAITLAYLAAKGKTPVKAAIFLTTMLDYTDAGDLGVFIDDEQISVLEKRMNDCGFLDGKEMALTFNMLRANDLIWSFVVNNYLLGKDPFPFDLLYWNSDSTRMPAKMHSFYLRNMYLNNNLVKKKIKLDGVTIDLTKIETPSYFLSTLKDHIAPWKSTYEGAKYFKNAVFTLADSGHIAGVVNPPATSKYPHWVNGKLDKTADEWLKGSKEVTGSWWLDVKEWLKQYSGAQVPARKIGKSIEDAPGSYVKVRS